MTPSLRRHLEQPIGCCSSCLPNLGDVGRRSGDIHQLSFSIFAWVPALATDVIERRCRAYWQCVLTIVGPIAIEVQSMGRVVAAVVASGRGGANGCVSINRLSSGSCRAT
jgi:hypothetical protein